MKLRRRYKRVKNEDDEECLIETTHHREHEYSKVRRWIWKFAKGTWKAFKIGFQTTITSQPFCVALEPTAVAATIVEYRIRKREEEQQRRQ